MLKKYFLIYKLNKHCRTLLIYINLILVKEPFGAKHKNHENQYK